VPADIRKQLWEYDQVLNTQRDKVYLERRKALASKDLSPLLIEYAERTVDDILEASSCQYMERLYRD
jgi:preprotein translocase subunit SecA